MRKQLLEVSCSQAEGIVHEDANGVKSADSHVLALQYPPDKAFENEAGPLTIGSHLRQLLFEPEEVCRYEVLDSIEHSSGVSHPAFVGVLRHRV